MPLQRQLVNVLSRVHREAINRFSPDAHLTFFPLESFPWIAEVERDWQVMRADLEHAIAEYKQFPRFAEISSRVNKPGSLRTLFFRIYGHDVEETCRKYPGTAAILRRIPNMTTAMFSVLPAGTRVPAHEGPTKAVLRYHLGLIVPASDRRCSIRVGSDVRNWSEGKSLIFDDTHDHEVWNLTEHDRAVLFVDFVRPLPGVLRAFNDVWVRAAGRFADVIEAHDNAERHARRDPAKA